jgi:serine/threonine protein kinase
MSAQEFPEWIGPYRVRSVLGEGGVGTVYLATQEEPFRRDVAIKLVRLGMHTRDILARFELERQALAMMNHSNIAKVFDAGETEIGRPYFVMEYIPGEPITSYCDRQRLGIRARLRLFADVCHAVQHAHQKGIIHRDIKPTNVLVKTEDGRHVPVIIDFGLAKVIHQALTDSLLTRDGQLVGTPQYMSPEQVEGPPGDVDTRADVYSLGALLYELIVGSPPHDRSYSPMQPLKFVEGVRDEDSPRPSLRWSHLDAQAVERARARSSDRESVLKEIRGDLDWITLKAVEKDRERRYASAVELAADVDRFLRGEPILARPPTAAYRLQRFVARHTVLVVMTLAMVLAMIVGSGLSSYWYVRAESMRKEKAAIMRIASSVRDKTANAHLWFEEALAGDRSLDLERDVYRPMRESMELVTIARTGGITEDGPVKGVGSGRLDFSLDQLLTELELLVEITEERWSKQGKEGAAGNALDQRYDGVYQQILTLSRGVSNELESTTAEDWRRSARLSMAVNFVALLGLVVLVGAGLRIWSNRK